MKFTQKTVSVKDIVFAIPYGKMTNDQMARINTLREKIDGHFADDLDAWVDGFMRDACREKEIRLWEAIADVYQRLSQKYRLSPSRKKRLIESLLCLSLGDTIDDMDGVSKRTIERAFKQACHNSLLRLDQCVALLVSGELAEGPDTFNQNTLPLIFETPEAAESYVELVNSSDNDATPAWSEKLPGWPGNEIEIVQLDELPKTFNLCLAVHEGYAEVIAVGR